MTRCMLKSKKIPKEFWAVAVSYAVYLFNCYSIKSLKDVTPQKAWSRCKPSVSHLHVFGSIAYAHVSNQERVKLDDRTEKYIFIGYDANSKGYKFNPNNKKIVISRDIEFDEKASWDWSSQQEESYNSFSYFEEEDSAI